MFRLYYHLVLIVKYRRKLIDGIISNYTEDVLVRLGENYNISLVEWNHDFDHVHILFEIHTNTEISKFINVYKRELWKEYFWSRDICLLITGGSPIEVIKKYIENQGMK